MTPSEALRASPLRTFRAMAFDGGDRLREIRLRLRPPGSDQLLLRVHTCGVCRTDLHLLDGDLHAPRRPIVPGHEIVGTVLAAGPQTSGFSVGDRVGATWLARSCLHCRWCTTGRENLCPQARFNGLHEHGGYATHALVDARFCVHLPDRYDDLQAAPLLCAGLIGYRALRAAGDEADHIGLYGFGAAGHLIAQVAIAEARHVYAFTRPGDGRAQALATRLGATWAGDSTQRAPRELDAALIFAADGALVPRALAQIAPGGTVVCGGIHMSDIPSFAYRLLWGERVVKSIANLTRADARDFMALAARIPLQCEVEAFSLGDANEALSRMRAGRITGAAVLDCRGD